MSSSSNNRPSSLVERRIANDNGASRPRLPSGQQGGSRPERDPRRTQSPQTSASGGAHRRVPSTSQRTKSALEERRTERVQVTTRETLTSRTRSPERRPASRIQQQERVRQGDISRANSADHRPRLSRAESTQRRLRSVHK
jgi:gamma-tubulin complex component 2